MEKKKKKIVDTNLGILLICLFSSIFTLVDFLIVDKILDSHNKCEECTKCDIKDNGVNKDNASVIDGGKSEELLSESEALMIGKELFDKMGRYYIYYGPVEYDADGDTVHYRKNDDGSFTVLDADSIDGNFVQYAKLDADKLREIANDDFINKYVQNGKFSEYAGGYYIEIGGRASTISYIDTELKVISITSDKIVFDAISSYFADDSERNHVSVEDAKKDYKTNAFELVLENNQWKISSFTKVY